MKEWRLKLTYKLILFMFFLVSPFFLFGLLKKNELKIELYIEIYFILGRNALPVQQSVPHHQNS